MSMHVPRSLRHTAEFTIPALKFKRERVSKGSSFFKRGVSFIKFVEYLIVCRLVRFVYEEQFCTSYAPFCFFFFYQVQYTPVVISTDREGTVVVDSDMYPG